MLRFIKKNRTCVSGGEEEGVTENNFPSLSFSCSVGPDRSGAIFLASGSSLGIPLCLFPLKSFCAFTRSISQMYVRRRKEEREREERQRKKHLTYVQTVCAASPGIDRRTEGNKNGGMERGKSLMCVSRPFPRANFCPCSERRFQSGAIRITKQKKPIQDLKKPGGGSLWPWLLRHHENLKGQDGLVQSQRSREETASTEHSILFSYRVQLEAERAENTNG